VNFTDSSALSYNDCVILGRLIDFDSRTDAVDTERLLVCTAWCDA